MGDPLGSTMSTPTHRTPDNRRMSFNLGGEGENVRVTAPLCAIIVAITAVAIPLWVCAMSASSAPWMDPNEFMMAQYGTVGGTHQEYQTSMEMKTGATTGGIKHKRRT